LVVLIQALKLLPDVDDCLMFDNNLADGLKKKPVGRRSNGGKRNIHLYIHLLKVKDLDVWGLRET